MTNLSCFQESDNCPEVPPNNVCNDSMLVETFPYKDQGNIAFGSLENNEGSYSCSNINAGASTVWYRIVAPSNTACISATVNAGYTGNPILAVYNGDCSSLACLSQTGYGNGQLNWRVEQGKTYYFVYAEPSWGQKGDFEITFKVSSIDIHYQ